MNNNTCNKPIMLFIKDDKPQHVDEIDLASGY